MHYAGKLGGHGAIPPQFDFRASVFNSWPIDVKIGTLIYRSFSDPPIIFFGHRACLGTPQDRFSNRIFKAVQKLLKNYEKPDIAEGRG